MDDDLYAEVGASAPPAGGAAAGGGGTSVAALQAELAAARTALSAWEDAFRDDPCCAGSAPAPATVLDALLELRGAERDAREAGREAARRCAALAARADAADADASELRARLAAAVPMPAARQVSTLMLDPGAARELSRLVSALDAARDTIKQKDEEIAALGFSKESKQGRMLMARVRMLIKENEEFGAQVSEGRLHALETEIVLLREQVSRGKRAYAELAESAAALSAENEALQLRALGGGAAAGGAADVKAEAEAEAAPAPAAGAKRARRGAAGGE